MSKGWAILFFFILLFLLPANNALAEGGFQQPEIDTGELEGFLKNLDRELDEKFPELSISNLFEDLKKGKFKFDFAAILQTLLNYSFKELLANSHFMGQILVLVILSAILKNLNSAFEQATISKLANSVIFLAVVSVVLYSFNHVIKIGTTAIEQVMDFIYALLPVLLTLIAAIGGFTTATVVHPFVLAGISILGSLIIKIVFPLIYFASVMMVVASVSEQFQVSSFANLLKEISIGVLGLFLTIFIGILSIQGTASAMADGVALRTAKFLTGSFIPIVGKVFSEALETVIGTTLLLKSAVSLIGVIVVVIICLLPAIKIIAIFLIYRLTAAIVQPFGEVGIAKMLESLSGIMIVIFGTVVAVGLMFFIVITIIAGLGNMTVFLR
ncbi:MAG: stage III sporulation protein AE [Bacillota bacterium]